MPLFLSACYIITLANNSVSYGTVVPERVVVLTRKQDNNLSYIAATPLFNTATIHGQSCVWGIVTNSASTLLK